MKYTVRTFGITKDILGGKVAVIELDGNTVADLRATLERNYPAIKSLNSLMIAVNNAYAMDEDTLAEGDEIALIPPVSGG